MDKLKLLQEEVGEEKEQIKIELENRIKEIESKLKNVEGNKCEIYSRVVGYHRPVENWNDGKKEEFNNRNDYSFNM
jgi:hypothetical protein